MLDEFCVVFKLLNSFLGIAFSDVKEKVAIIKGNNLAFPGHEGFFAFVLMEMEKKIHLYNGDNNGDLKAPKEFKKYNSTARNLLRMMWLFTFIRTTFEEMRNLKTSLPDILAKAYDAAFGEKHSWVIRKGAKLAIYASGNRKELVEAVTGEKYDEQKFADINVRFLEKLVPIHEALWGFYRHYKLVDLP